MKDEIICVCAWCKKVKDEEGNWQEGDPFIFSRTKLNVSHGICPSCEKAALEDVVCLQPDQDG